MPSITPRSSDKGSALSEASLSLGDSSVVLRIEVRLEKLKNRRNNRRTRREKKASTLRTVFASGKSF
jgi:hypothetical protein